MLQLLHLVQLIINTSNKTKSIVIHLQKVLSQLVEEIQELNFLIYFNLVLKFWRMFNLKKPKRNEHKTFNTIHLIFHNQFNLSNKIQFNNLLNQNLNKLCLPSRNKCKIKILIRLFLLCHNKLFQYQWLLNRLFHLYQRLLNKWLHLYQWFPNKLFNLYQ